MNIVLIGYRGTGKTTIGRKVASLLGRDFMDTDALIMDRAGKTIKDIFADGSESAFRELESAVIADASLRKDAVIATGGGAVLRPENVKALKANAKVIWLRGDAETLHARIVADAASTSQRPRLAESAGGELEEVKSLLAKSADAVV